MAIIYKRSKKRNAVWIIQYLDAGGDRRTVKGFTDKGLTEQLAARLEDEARLRRTGMIVPEVEKLTEQRISPLQGHIASFKESISHRSA
jgi:hypothetical protein